ncbi:MAG: M15 family metallopeptidase [Patescibacteria group bacterium]
MKKLDSKWFTIKYLVAYGFALVAIAFVTLASYSYAQLSHLRDDVSLLTAHISSLELTLASTTGTLAENITQTRSSLSDALIEAEKNANNLEKQLGKFQKEVGNISGTVDDLEKLSKTDPELLQKYSKVFFLNEHYSPPRLAEIPDFYEYIEERTTKIHESVWPYLKEMIDDAGKDNVKIYVSSGFRSFNEQGALKGAYTVTYGSGTANQFSADQGYSEHQLGTTVDLITGGLNGSLDGFEKTPAYTWLLANAYKYGFVLSYPQNNGYYVFEPWHWRFVGVKLATYLKKQGKNFYDLDQRVIDTYLISVFE